MIVRRTAVFALLAAALPALAQQPAKTPKIEPTDFKDPGKITIKYVQGQKERYVTTTIAKAVIGVEVAGQPFTISNDSTNRGQTTFTVADVGPPAKIEIVTDHIQSRTKVDNPMMPVEITINDKNVKAVSNGQVLYDSAKGGDNAMAAQFTEAVKQLGKKVTITADADGKAGSKLEGDPEAMETMGELLGQGLYGVIFKGQTGFAVGDTWDVETEIRAMQAMKMKQPLKLKNAYKVRGTALVDGVPCLHIETTTTAKGSDLDAVMKQAGMEVDTKLSSFGLTMTGNVYFDPVQSRAVYTDGKGTVEFVAVGDVPGAGKLDMKAVIDIKSSSWMNAAW